MCLFRDKFRQKYRIYIDFIVFQIKKHPILNVVKSVRTADGVIMIRFVNVLRVIWENIAKQRFAIHSV